MFDISTICAIASPSGTGAIACLRLSGKEALNILNALIIESNTDIEKFQARKLYKCSLGKAQEIVDEVLVTYYKAPHSYTGEDSVEIFCHGGAYIQQRLLELMLEAGAKPAAPGEFTQRAFLNGRLDLSQSEAVAELISGVTASQHNLAMKQLRGGVKNEIAELRQELLNFVSLVELELDFPEEDVEFANREDLQALIADIISKINKLILGFKYGNAIKNGLGVAIVGRPNTGKSSLLNLLLNEDRAIVSDIPGTTRDVIEDSIVIDGILFRFIDTAGIRNTQDEIELLGISRTQDRILKADIILLVAESLNSDLELDTIVNEIISLSNNQTENIVLLLNKSDLSEPKTRDFPVKTINISVKTQQNIDLLKTYLVDSLKAMKFEENDVIISNIRHLSALQNALEALNRAQEAMRQGLPGDLLSQDVREAIHYLGAITGEIGTEEVLGTIFQNFCIGK